MQVKSQPLQYGHSLLNRELVRDLLVTDSERPATRFHIALPWEAFASAWSLAEDRLARLEQQLASSDLRHSWIWRADFEEASAITALKDDPIALHDLALVDAGATPPKTTSAWFKAKAVLSLRRHIARSGPDKILTTSGILGLQERLSALLAGTDCSAPTIGRARLQSSRHQIQLWLHVVEELRSMPTLPAAAIALRVWRRASPLDSYNEEIGLVLASLLLWHWGKTRGMTACLAVGLNEAEIELDDRATLGAWIQNFCRAIQAAANKGLNNHNSLVRGRSRLVRLLTQHRGNSRLPRLAWFFLNYPTVSRRFITQRLDVSAQGTSWLLEALIREGIVQETTGKTRDLAYSLA